MSPLTERLERLAAIPTTRHELQVLGRTTVYWEYGTPGAERTLLLVHGFRGDHHGLEPVVAELPGYRFLAPDLPGFGASEALDGGHALEDYVAWLKAFQSALGAAAADVVLGHSFGSIVVAAAIAEGLRARSLVLVNPIAVPALEGRHPMMSRVADGYYRLAGALPERLGRALLASPVIVRGMSIGMAKTRDKELRRWIHGQHHAYFSAFADRDMLLQAYEASVSANVADFAAGIRMPTLLIAAELDDITPPAANFALKAVIPGAELRILPRVGHLIHYEAPDRAAEAIVDFLDASPRS